jgi:hypothetical protein
MNPLRARIPMMHELRKAVARGTTASLSLTSRRIRKVRVPGPVVRVSACARAKRWPSAGALACRFGARRKLIQQGESLQLRHPPLSM